MHDKKKLHYVIGSVVVAVALIATVFVVMNNSSNDNGNGALYGGDDTMFYDITFDSNGGSYVESQEVEHGETVAKPIDDPTKVGHTFKGWYLDGYPFDFNTQIDSDITLVAKWQIITYTVTFVDYKDYVIDTQTVDHGSAAVAPEVPPRVGYNFTAWDTDFANITSDLTVTAEYERIVYTVTFDSNGGVAAVQYELVKHGDMVNEPKASKEGYTLVGWFHNNSMFDFDTPIVSEKTLIAHWEIIRYTVTFVDRDDTVTQTVDHGSAAVEPEKPEKVGHTFLGWFLHGNDTAFVFSTLIFEDKTLIAEWQIITYTVTFNSLGGSDVPDALVDHGNTVARPAEDPTKEGYNFTGWFLAGNVFEFDTPIVSNVTITAGWSIKTYTVTFVDWNDEVLSVQTVNHGSAATAPEKPPREGFNPAGWDVRFDNITSDLTVTAQYAVITFTITGQVFQVLGSIDGVTQTEVLMNIEYIWYTIVDVRNSNVYVNENGEFIIEGVPIGSTVKILGVFGDGNFELFDDLNRLPHFAGEFLVNGPMTDANVYVLCTETAIYWHGLDSDDGSGLLILVLVAAVVAALAVGVFIFHRMRA
ncbi:MAG: InlB B-repeat-containing protein [Methanomassiliicoccaceae archaeon]|nr:InlB B-repeat-containing protein [Methanomassiliicoccaceae archaeon]